MPTAKTSQLASCLSHSCVNIFWVRDRICFLLPSEDVLHSVWSAIWFLPSIRIHVAGRVACRWWCRWLSEITHTVSTQEFFRLNIVDIRSWFDFDERRSWVFSHHFCNSTVDSFGLSPRIVFYWYQCSLDGSWICIRRNVPAYERSAPANHIWHKWRCFSFAFSRDKSRIYVNKSQNSNLRRSTVSCSVILCRLVFLRDKLNFISIIFCYETNTQDVYRLRLC